MNPPDRAEAHAQWAHQAQKAWQQDGFLSSNQTVYTTEMPERFKYHDTEEFSSSNPMPHRDERINRAVGGQADILPKAQLHTAQQGLFKPNVEALRQEMQSGRYSDDIEPGNRHAPYAIDDGAGRLWLVNGHHRAAAAYLENRPMRVTIYGPRRRALRFDPEISHRLNEAGFQTR